MEELLTPFARSVAEARTRNRKQFRFALLIAILIALLLWQTQWVSLRPGLQILFAGQMVLAIVFFYRSSTSTLTASELLSRDEQQIWFAREKSFVRYSSAAESVIRVLGFVMLAYGFWTATHILWITFMLGVAYPVISYFGIAQRNNQQILRRLSAQEQEIE